MIATAKRYTKRYTKPYPSFPLTPHKRGWCKKINKQVVVICGHLPPEEALHVWLKKAPALYAKAAPEAQSAPTTPGDTTVTELKAKFLALKEKQYKARQITGRSYMSIVEALKPFEKAVTGKVADLRPNHFSDYRFVLSSKYKIYTLDRHITVIKGMFNWAVRNEVIERLPKWGDSFDKPSTSEKRKHRQEMAEKHGKRLFTPEQIKSMIDKANPALKAMILLGINSGLGNTDVAEMPISAIDLSTGVLDFPRPKTHQERRAILWTETITAVQEYLKARPVPMKADYERLLFLTRSGQPWVTTKPVEKDGKVITARRRDYVTNYFNDLMKKAGIAKRQGLNFYALRHTYRTIADRVNDQNAILLTMGHSIPGISASYVQRIDESRLKAVSDYVRGQVLGD